MSSDNKPLVLNKTNIQDIISEGRLLREFAIYGCDDQPGKIYGYNPFSKKCVDLTGYNGPTLPVAVPGIEPARKDGDRSAIEAFTSLGGAKDMILGILEGAFTPEGIVDCATENPFLSGLGYFIGQTKAGKAGTKAVVMGLPKLVVSAVTPGGIKGAVKGEAAIGRELAQYAAKNKGAVSDAFLTGLKKIRGGTGKAIAYVILAAGAAYGGKKAYDKFQDNKDTQDFFEWMENELIGGESFNNLKCLGAGMVLSLSLGALGRAGTSGFARLAGKAITAPVAVPYNILKGILNSKSYRNMLSGVVDAVFKSVKTKNLDMFNELKAAGLLSKEAKVALDTAADGSSFLKLEGLPYITRIPADKVPPSLKKFATEEGLVFKSSDLQKELADVSKKITERINGKIQDSAGMFRSSPYKKQLDTFRKILDKYGSLSQAAIRSEAFSGTVEMLADMHKNADEMVKGLVALEKNLIKQRTFANSAIKQISKGTKLPDLVAIERAILKSDLDDVGKVLNDMYPNLKSSSPEAFDRIQEYFTNFKKFDKTQKELTTQLELGKKALLDDTDVFKGLLKDADGSKNLEDWLASGAGEKWKRTFDELPSRGETIMKNLGPLVGNKFKNALRKFLASEDLAILGGAAATAAIVNIFDEKVENKQELNDIINKLQKTLDGWNYSDYFVSQSRIDGSKHMMALIKTLNKGSYSKETQKVLDKWEEYTSSNKKHIDEINNYLNQNAEEERPTPSDLKNRTMNIIKNVLTPKEFSKLTNEVIQMSKKDIKQLVAEVLNENSGMGYGKYPYDIGNSDEQPAEDYIEEWKALAVSLIKDESRDTAVSIAKILVRDLELFEDVLDLAGQNQSVGSEILRKLKEAKEN